MPFATFPAARALRRRWFSLPLALALLGAVTTVTLPARAGLFSDDEARKAVADLRAEVLQRNAADDARLAHLETSIDTVQQATLKLQAALDRLDQTVRNLGLPALASQIDAVAQDQAKLRGQLEVQANDLQQAQKRSKEFYLDLDTRLHVLESAAAKAAEQAKAGEGGNAGDGAAGTGNGQPALAGINPPVAVSQGKPGLPPAPPSVAESTAYDKAYRAYKEGSFGPALKAFQAFARTYTNSIYSPNVAYWIGMSHYRLKDYGAAATALKATANAYADSPKAADALFSLASVQLDQSDTAGARQTLEDLINRYPNSDPAAKAKLKLGRK